MLACLFAAAPDLGPLILPLLVGAVAVFLLLPRPRAYPALLGGVAGLAALVLAAWLLVPVAGLTVETFLFYVFSGLSVLSGILLITQHNPARAALSFALVVLSSCGLFLLLAAPFLMAATIVVYAGAIIVTFLFVIMLAQQAGMSDADDRSREPLLATVTGFLLLGALLYVLQVHYESVRVVDKLLSQVRQAQAKLDGGSVAGVDRLPEELGAQLAEEIGKIEAKQENPDSRAVTEHLVFRKKLRALVEEFRFDEGRWPTADKATVENLKPAVAKLAHELIVARQQQTMLQPSPLVSPPLSPPSVSSLSGPAVTVPTDQLRYDEQGRPQMPAENTHYLGRSLFTDFLIPVELGGMLLLVATVGAIAIAQRKSPQERPS